MTEKKLVAGSGVGGPAREMWSAESAGSLPPDRWVRSAADPGMQDAAAAALAQFRELQRLPLGLVESAAAFLHGFLDHHFGADFSGADVNTEALLRAFVQVVEDELTSEAVKRGRNVPFRKSVSP